MLISKEGYKDKKGKPRVRVTLKCDGENCGHITVTGIDNFYQYQKRYGENISYCKQCSAKIAGAKRKGIKNPKCGRPRPKGKDAPTWKGGRYIDYHGYVMIAVENSNPSCGWAKYRKEHIVIAEQIIGRKLYKHEVVHHIDGNKQNNSVENLDVLDNDQIHHRETHHSLMLIGYELYKHGIIGYDKQKHIYYIKEQNEGSIQEISTIHIT